MKDPAQKSLRAIHPFPGDATARAVYQCYNAIKGRNVSKFRIFNGVESNHPSDTWSQISAHSIPLAEAALRKEIETVFEGYQAFPFLSLYVHGSWADDTRTAFSDLDDLVVVDLENIPNSAEARKAAAWLNKVDLRFCRIDPLQHHGHWIITKDSLHRFNQGIMPLQALEGSVNLQGPPQIQATYSNQATLDTLRTNVQNTASHVSALLKKAKDGTLNAYTFKQLIGMILILPSYAFQSKHFNYNKRESIEQSPEIFSDLACQSISYASKVRQEWNEIITPPNFFFNLISRSVSNPHLHRKLARTLSPKVGERTLSELPLNAIETLLEESLKAANAETVH